MARSPEQIAINESELAPFVAGNSPAGRAHGLLQQQKGAWELLRNGYDTLRSIRTKVFEFDGSHIEVHFNAGRLTSTSAKVDSHSIRERKCFLCPENLPAAQRGIACNGDYLVLCNPFPIFPEHFTISSLRHTPQRILSSFAAFLGFTRELGDRYTVFYNGPKCGASAPDHLHFQAGNKSFLPVAAEYEAAKARQATRLLESDTLRAYSVDHCLRRFIAFESPDAGRLQRAFAELHQVLEAGGTQGEEPMMNILGFYHDEQWRILVFPRLRHRPSFYFKEGEEKLLISPAAVEMGGACMTPREQDFQKVTRDNLVQLFEEVCVSPQRFADIKARFAERLAAFNGARATI